MSDVASINLKHSLTGEILPERMHWLIRLRWGAVLGMAALTALVRWVIGVELSIVPIFALAGLVGAYNVLIWKWLRWRERSGRQDAATGRSMRHIANAQIALDLLVLTLMLHFAGGVTNPVALFLVFHMAIAAVLLPRGDAFAQAGWAAMLYATMAVLEMLWPWLHRPMVGYPTDTLGGGRLHAEPLYVAGQVGVLLVTLLLIVYFTSDISRRLRGSYQQLAKAHEELEQLEHTKSRFLRVASHQLRGPLAAIHSLLTAMEHSGSALSEPQERLYRRVKDRAEVMMELLDEMMTLSAMKESRSETEVRRRQSVDEAVRSAAALMGQVAQDRGVALKVEASSGAEVLAWERALDDILGNLLHNAVKYSRPGGVVEVSSRRNGCGVVLTVKDDGIGIPSVDQERLFSEFYRAGNAKKHAGGTGLGLSIVKEAVERLGGRIELASLEGRGTTVRVELPA